MRNALDKLDQSPLWFRISLIVLLAGILVSGLFFVRTQRSQTRISDRSSTRVSSMSSSSSSSSESDEEKARREEETTNKEAEEAVKQLEDHQVEENIAPAQEKVDKIKDEALKNSLQERIKLVSEAIAAQRAAQAPTQPITPVTPQVQVESTTTYQASVTAPNTVVETPVTQNVQATVPETPVPAETPQP